MKKVRAFLGSSLTTNEQRVKFAILCAIEVSRGPEYAELRQWAEKWLNSEGQDIRPEFDTWTLRHNHPSQ